MIGDMLMNDVEKKVMVLGCSSGKATILRHICSKTVETVAMEYGNTTFEGVKMHFFGASSSERFEFMHDVISKKIDGALILVDENGLTNADLKTASSIKENGLPYVIIASQVEEQYPFDQSFKEVPVVYANSIEDTDDVYKGMKVLLNIMQTAEHSEEIKTVYGA